VPVVADTGASEGGSAMKKGDRVKVTACHSCEECKYHNHEGEVLYLAKGNNVKVKFPDDEAWFYADELTIIEEAK
jgi:D-arabinose 1-dehydrogenase-like Zn-dependent alcohol dehydrogenase